MQRRVRQRTSDSPQTLNQFFLTLYTNARTHSNSVNQFYENCLSNNQDDLQFTRADVEKFLHQQKSYVAFRAVPEKSIVQHITAPVVGRFRKWQADLIDMQKYFTYNDGYRYILTIIDVFSKYAIAIPIKDKETATVGSNLYEIFSTTINGFPMYPIIFQTDNGSEFTGKATKIACSMFHIQQTFSLPYSPLGYIERFNQTLKKKIFTWMAAQRSQGDPQYTPGRYIDALNDLVYNYNHTVHSTLKETPTTIQFCNSNKERCRNLQDNTYNRLVRKNERNPVIDHPYPARSKVLILSYLNPYLTNLERNRLKLDYNKASTQKWTTDEFTIAEVRRDEDNPNILRYVLKDSFNHIMSRKFYHHELQVI